MGDTKFIRVNGRVVPIRADRYKKQVKDGVKAGAANHVGLQLLHTKSKKAQVAGAGFLAYGIGRNLVSDIQAFNDAVKYGKANKSFFSGAGEYIRQSAVRAGGNVVGNVGAKFTLSGTSKGLKNAAKYFRNGKNAKNVTPKPKLLKTGV